MAKASEAYAFLGWHGFGLEHPKTWELCRVEGSRQSTYLALDDGERIRMEVSWKPVKRKVLLTQVVDGQVSALERTAKRRKMAFEVERGRHVRSLRGFEYEAFSWKADVRACELVARCKECGRVILVRVIGDEEDAPVAEADRVFASLGCSCGRDSERWGTFGLDVEIPTRFNLERSSLKAGMCELVFSDRRTELSVMRVGLGRAILEKEKMTAWYGKTAWKLLRPFEVTWSEVPVRGHIGYEGLGVLRGSRRLLGIFRPDRGLSVRVFYCEPSDKILAVSADGPGDVTEVVQTVCDGLACHGGTPPKRLRPSREGG